MNGGGGGGEEVTKTCPNLLEKKSVVNLLPYLEGFKTKRWLLVNFWVNFILPVTVKIHYLAIVVVIQCSFSYLERSCPLPLKMSKNFR